MVSRKIPLFFRASKDLLDLTGGISGVFKTLRRISQKEGPRGLVRVLSLALRTVSGRARPSSHDFREWYTEVGLGKSRHKIIENGPLISVVMPTFDPPLKFLRSAVDSVLAQSYSNWELCIADDASTNPEIKKYLRTLPALDSRIKVIFCESNGHISKATNAAVAISSGEYLAFLDHDDYLPTHSLNSIAKAVDSNPSAKLFYSDEAHINSNGEILSGHIKGGLNRELALAYNYFCHLSVYETKLLNSLGGLRVGTEGAQDYDLALRALEVLSDSEIVHVPEILYFWRVFPGSTAYNIDAKPYARQAGINAVVDHLARTNRRGQVGPSPDLETANRVSFELLDPTSEVSIIIPTRDNGAVLRKCIHSIRALSTHKNYEILIVDNGSHDPETLQIIRELGASENSTVLVVDEPFNYSRLNNLAATKAKGNFLLLLNDDTEVITPNWMEELMSFAQFDEIGAVGARLWYENDTLQHGGVILGLGSVAGHSHRHLSKNEVGYMGRGVLHQNFSAVTGACLMIKRADFEQVGGLTESLTIGYNDVDLCLKLTELGKRNVWTPYAELIHYESLSRGYDTSPEKIQRALEETEYMVKSWGNRINADPYFSPNFSRNHEDYSLSSAVKP